MKKITYFILLLLLVYDAKAQNISFSSNGHINNFTKIDTLFFTEYAGKKPSTKTAAIDTTFSSSLMQFDSSFGFTTKTLAEAEVDGSKLRNFKKIFTTTYYAYTDGALEAPISMIFFKPKNDSAVKQDFSPLGRVVKHPDLKGYYYLYLKTNIYNNGDKIFALCDSLNNAGLTIIVEPVFVRQLKLNTDPQLPNEWNVTNTGQYSGTPGADMKVANVWNMGYTGKGVKVAVIDLGVDLTHPDLQANLLSGYDATGNNSGGAPIYDQYNTHGTECAGIIGEIANNIGGAGVAYNAHIIPIRFGTVAPPDINPNGYITTSDTWESNCFNFAVNNGADIISNSWGSHGGSPSAQVDAAISNAVTNGRGGKGTIVLFAAGNENSFIDYPASNTNVIAVGASCECDTRKRSSNDPNLVNPGVTPDPLDVSCDGEFWWGSNFGTGLDVMAPGVYITTTTFTINPDGTHTDTYVDNFNGTSAATPNTAAVLALILSANPNLTGQEARNILESSTDKVGGYTYQSNISGQPNGTWSTDAGYGRLNACTAITQALSDVLIIFGDASFCTTSNPYTISNLPAGATVQWSASPSGIVTINSADATQTTLTWIHNGTITLAATVTGACGAPVTLTKQVTSGLKTPSFTMDASAGYCAGNWYEAMGFSNNDGSNLDYTYNWYINGTLYPFHQYKIRSTFATNTTGIGLTVSKDGCPVSNQYYQYFSCQQMFTVSPNPASTEITVKTDTSSILKIDIMDKMGNIKKSFNYGTMRNNAVISISDLPADIYTIRVFDGRQWSAKLFSKQ